MITLKELKDLLDELPADLDDLVVIMQMDEEGNGYIPFRKMDTNCVWVPTGRNSGEVWIRELSTDLIEAGYGEEDAWNLDDPADDAIPAIVLYP